MTAYRIVWEDEAKAREIELFVDYTLAAGVVQIDAIRPTQVTFYDLETRQAGRTIVIHTATARRILTEQYLASRVNDVTLEEEIQTQLDFLDDAVTAGAL